MKKLLDVEKSRSEHYADNQRDSVHRSSLLVPVLPNSEVSISLLNHFLIKRGITSVGCKVTAIDKNGVRLTSRLTTINEPCVYTMHLQRDFDVVAASFLVEFFSSENIYIPFPAVMVNHRTKNALSGVHSFNRVLADVFEDDDVNAIHVQEAAIDIVQNPGLSTFFVLAAGPFNLQAPITLRLSTSDSELHHSLNVNIPRFTQQLFELKNVVPEWSQLQGTLFIDQPDQKLFYGRLFVGQIAKDGSFVGNHSYYDSSHVEGEFWTNNNPSFRTYPVIQELDVLVRFYPIMSPSEIALTVIFNSFNGEQLGATSARNLLSPSTDFFELDIRKSATDASVDIAEVGSFTVQAIPLSGNTPTRINHQIVYRTTSLESSINTSLQNYSVIHSQSKPRTSWGQLIHSAEFETWLSLANDGYQDPVSSVQIKFYDENGFLTSESVEVPQRSVRSINMSEMLIRQSVKAEGEFLWYEYECPNYFLTALSISKHVDSGNCTGEHSF
jgi:hypothetical protein